MVQQLPVVPIHSNCIYSVVMLTFKKKGTIWCFRLPPPLPTVILRGAWSLSGTQSNNVLYHYMNIDNDLYLAESKREREGKRGRAGKKEGERERERERERELSLIHI